jgi:hypothetical protein
MLTCCNPRPLPAVSIRDRGAAGPATTHIDGSLIFGRILNEPNVMYSLVARAAPDITLGIVRRTVTKEWTGQPNQLFAVILFPCPRGVGPRIREAVVDRTQARRVGITQVRHLTACTAKTSNRLLAE